MTSVPGAAGRDLPSREPASVWCSIFRVTSEGLSAAGTVRPGDELALLVEVRAGLPARQPGSELAVELWRGDRLRDRQQQAVSWGTDATLRAAFGLGWSEGQGASVRLTCRVLLDGREVGRQAVLLGQPAVDAQGRFPDSAPPSASAATLLAFVRELEGHLGPAGDE
jgi:hypothetical protein